MLHHLGKRAQVAQLVEQRTEKPFSHVESTGNKLNSEQVRAIRARCSSGERRGTVAVEFGVSQSLVSQICAGVLWRSAGGPLSRVYVKRDLPLANRIAARTDRSAGDDACWPWTGRSRGGYGSLTYLGREIGAHHAVLEMKLGRALLPGEVTRHACHNRRCVNPAHLDVGTAADNAADMVNAGRSLFGERSPAHKLTIEQVREIREACAVGARGCKSALARRYGVSFNTIKAIASGRKWTTALALSLPQAVAA